MNIKKISRRVGIALGGKKIKKGSILAYSLIILSMMLATAVAISTAVILGKKSASVNEYSTQAIQTSDSGLQYALKKINDKINDGKGFDQIKDPAAFPNCGASNPDDVTYTNGSSFKLAFYSNPGCTPASLISDCTKPLTTIACVRSIGNYRGTARAASMAIGSNDTKLLLHFDGNGTTFVDSETPTAKTITPFGAVNQVNSPSKFGKSASFNVSGTNGYLRTPYVSDFDLSSKDWTIDAWFNSSSFASPQAIISKDKNGSNFDWAVLIMDSSTLKLLTNAGADNLTVTIPVAKKMNVGEWHHVAFVRHGFTNNIYLDGVFYGSNSMDITNDSKDYVTVGACGYNNPNTFFNGYIDELRVSRGIARWTSNFTPPTAPYSN